MNAHRPARSMFTATLFVLSAAAAGCGDASDFTEAEFESTDALNPAPSAISVTASAATARVQIDYYAPTAVAVVKFAADTGRSSCDPGPDQVSVYEDKNYKGRCAVLDLGFYPSNTHFALADDSISSIRVGVNVKAELCRGSNYASDCDVFEENETLCHSTWLTRCTTRLSEGWGDRASSIKVLPRNYSCSRVPMGATAFFTEENFRGKCVVLPAGTYPHVSTMGIQNDAISSFFNYRAITTLGRHPYFDGDKPCGGSFPPSVCGSNLLPSTLTTAQDRTKLSGDDFDDHTSSIRIEAQ